MWKQNPYMIILLSVCQDHLSWDRMDQVKINFTYLVLEAQKNQDSKSKQSKKDASILQELLPVDVQLWNLAVSKNLQ